MKNKFLLVVGLTFGLFQVAFGQIPGLPPKPLDEPDDPKLYRAGYLIGPGDVISGGVLGEPQFNFSATIDEDGRFQVPFFERPVMAQCKTERELRKDITRLVSKYLKTPLVQVAVTERKSRRL
jgi:protein involved in polysaccharide export with SLBB domain